MSQSTIQSLWKTCWHAELLDSQTSSWGLKGPKHIAQSAVSSSQATKDSQSSLPIVHAAGDELIGGASGCGAATVSPDGGVS
jgi:hypothetical protein